MKSVRAQGFSLVELLVLVGVLGIFSAVLLPAISNAVLQSDLTDVGLRGRDIFVAITSANSQRKLLGLESVWPKTLLDGWTEREPIDISKMTFSSSTDYFRVLADGDHMGTADWNPYVVGFDYSKLSGVGVPAPVGSERLTSENNMWVIAANVREEMPDILPVLVARNFDCSRIYADLEDASNTVKIDCWSSYTYLTPFSNKAFVMVRKGGAVFKARGKYASVHVIYQGQSFMTTIPGSAAAKFMYLGPDSVQCPM